MPNEALLRKNGVAGRSIQGGSLLAYMLHRSLFMRDSHALLLRSEYMFILCANVALTMNGFFGRSEVPPVRSVCVFPRARLPSLDGSVPASNQTAQRVQ